MVSPTQPELAGDTSVWNWISTGGLNQGTMAIRFQSIDPDDPTKPTVVLKVVPLSELASVLPPGTVPASPAERAVQIAARGQDSTGASRHTRKPRSGNTWDAGPVWTAHWVYGHSLL